MTLMDGLAALASQPTAWVALATLVAMEVVPREALDDLGQHQRRPFAIGQIAWQSQTHTGILRPSSVGPHR